MSTAQFDEAVEQTRLAIGEFVKGNPVPMQQRFSHRDDVSIATPMALLCADGSRWLR